MGYDVNAMPETKKEKQMKIMTDAELEQYIVECKADLKTSWSPSVERSIRNEQDAVRDRGKKQSNGLCPRCGTYCHGDCDC